MPAKKLFYASVPASASANPNTVLPIDPTTGKIGTPIPVGNDPRSLAASGDGVYLYVALYGDQTVQRINLQTNAIDRTFPFPPNQIGGGPPFIPTDMHAVPGSPQSVVLAVEDLSNQGMIALYGDNGLASVVPNSYPGIGIVSFTFLNSGTIYALPVAVNFPTMVALDSQGLHYTRPTTGSAGDQNSGRQIASDGVRLYTSSGEVWDPSTQALIGRIPFNFANNGGSIAVDAALGQSFAVGGLDEISPTGVALPVTLVAYDNQTLQLTGSVPFPRVLDLFPCCLTRWGNNGFAFIASGAGLADDELYLVSSSIAAQQTPAQVTFSPSSLDFGTTELGTSVATQTVTITSSGTAPLIVSGVAATPGFSASNGCAAPIPAGQSCQVTVSFVPATGGPFNGFVTVQDNANGGSQMVSLSGRAGAPLFLITPQSGVSATVSKGQVATFQLSVTGGPGLSGTVTLTCAGAPTTSCSVNPSSVNFMNGGSANFTVSVPDPSGATASTPSQLRILPAGFRSLSWLLSVLLLCGVAVAQTARRFAVPLALALTAALFLASCSSGGSPPSSSPSNPNSPVYNFTVSASTGVLSTSQSLKLTVQ